MTAAQRAAKALQRGGVFASVTKAPQSAYGVKIGERNLSAALELLRGAGINYGAVFSLDGQGGIREVNP